MFSSTVDTLLMEWIWSVTYGIYHIPINIIVSFILAKITVKYDSIPLLLLLILSQIVAFLILSGVVFGIVALGSVGDYVPTDNVYELSHTVLAACIGLGLLYTLFQSIFFYLLSKRYHIDIRHMVWIIFLGNLITAHIVYILFPFKG